MDGIPRPGHTPAAPARDAIAALDELLGRPVETAADVDVRLDVAERTAATLQGLGLDGESFIRFGLGGRIGGTLMAQILLLYPTSQSAADLFAWYQALDLDPDFPTRLRQPDAVTAEEVLTTVGRLRRAIDAWTENAPFRDLVTLTPPAADQLAKYLLMPATSEAAITAYTWLQQRCTVDALDRWSTDALVLEFQWQEGRASTAVPEAVLDGPLPAMDLLALEVARRLTDTRGDTVDLDTERLFWQLQEQAGQYLRQQRPSDAVALFDFFCRLHPEHERGLNNLGFCTLPLDPSAALRRLRAAEQKGYRPLAINLINQCCALRALGREAEALDRLEHYWQREYEHERSQPDGVLWRRRGTGWELYQEQKPVRALCRLGAELADTLAVRDRASRWRERVASLSSRSSSRSKQGDTAA